MNKSVLLLICVALFSSCKVTQKTAVTTPVDDIGVHQYPTVADLDVKPQKVSKTEEWNFVPFNWGQPSLDIRKGNMIAEMLEANGGDVLLEPQTIYTKKSFGKRSLTISGFVASFENFRKASDDDLKALEIGYEKSEKPVYNVAEKSPFTKLKDNISKPEKSGRNAFKIAAGFTSNRLVGFEANEGRKMGYMVNFEYQRHMPSHLYYAASMGFASRGYKSDNDELVSHVFNLMPLSVGYDYPLNKSLSIYANIGWYMDFAIADNHDYDYNNIRMFTDGIFDTGFRYGVGVRFGKLSLELMNYSGLMRRHYDDLDSFNQNSLTMSIGLTL